MCKKIRTYLALLCVGSSLILPSITAYAEEGYGPGFPDSTKEAVESTEAAPETSSPEAGIEAETTPTPETETQPTPETETQPTPETETPPEVNTTPEVPQEDATLVAMMPRFQATVLPPDTDWSRPFVNDELITLDGKGFRSISIFMTNTVGDVVYRAYSSAHGWTEWVMNGQQTPFINDGTLIEAIQLKVNGYAGNLFDIYYMSGLADGTETGWAKNGETTGSMGQGQVMHQFRMALNGKNLEWAYSTEKPVLSAAADGVSITEEGVRYQNGDGTNFTGWGWLGKDQYYFVDSVAVQGWHYINGLKYYFDESCKLVKDLEPIIGANGPFYIKINKEMNCTTIYAKDGANGFIIPLKSFLCSTGEDTPVGVFKTPSKYRWRLMNSGVYAQYATRLTQGFLLHSIIYDRQNNMTLWPSTYNYLGVARSAGCIRFLTGDAKWFYDHCAIGTSIEVYNSAIPGPYGRPAIEQIIPETQTWDPTDDSVRH